MTCKGTIRGAFIVLDEPLPFPDGQSVIIDVEPVRSSAPDGSPAAFLRAINALPRLTSEDVGELLLAIQSGRMPMRPTGPFDGDD